MNLYDIDYDIDYMPACKEVVIHQFSTAALIILHVPGLRIECQSQYQAALYCSIASPSKPNLNSSFSNSKDTKLSLTEISLVMGYDNV